MCMVPAVQPSSYCFFGGESSRKTTQNFYLSLSSLPSKIIISAVISERELKESEPGVKICTAVSTAEQYSIYSI